MSQILLSEFHSSHHLVAGSSKPHWLGKACSHSRCASFAPLNLSLEITQCVHGLNCTELLSKESTRCQVAVFDVLCLMGAVSTGLQIPRPLLLTLWPKSFWYSPLISHESITWEAGSKYFLIVTFIGEEKAARSLANHCKY